ncbi:MAG: tetratricopeptide repeat protein, partial [Candidatus Eisenbacteria bacterium]|nr:tetratricopeptide repeat protein [Candidatus Eisenbacteria bacterium]
RAGRRAGADSVMALAEHRYESELVTRRGGPAAPALLERISRARAQRGDQQGAMAALRAALNEPAALTLQPRLVLALANRALDQGRPDTALVYANWAQSGFEGRARPEALLLAAQAWEIRGTPDSALVLYQRFLDSYSQAPEASAKARFRRGMILEGLSRWEQARTEYRALAAAQPTHPLAFASLLRIVNHHASRGENDLARAEGRRAVETLDQILATERDEGISLDARVTRARLLAAIGADGEACDTFEDVWKRYESTPEGAAAALEAAVLAERALHDPARAVQIYQGVAARVADPAARQAAHAALIRLGGTHR